MVGKRIVEYRCLLISPSDVKEEREALQKLVNEWNAQIGQALDARVELVCWESHATPDMSDSPQGVINKQLLEDCDLGIAVFWGRLGTPTQEHESGSVEEIERLLAKGARVMIYFNTSPIPQDALKNDQFKQLQETKDRFSKQGLLGNYSSISNLEKQVQLHLTSVISELLSKDREEVSPLPPTPGVLTTPNVQVKVAAAVAGIPGHIKETMCVTVQNHSDQTVYLRSIYLEAEDGAKYYQPHDAITGDLLRRQELPPGKSCSHCFDPPTVKAKMAPEKLRCATAADEIDRIYRSPEEEFKKVVRNIFRDRG